MKTLVDCVKVELNLAGNVVNYDLITVNVAYYPAEVKNMAAQFCLTLF